MSQQLTNWTRLLQFNLISNILFYYYKLNKYNNLSHREDLNPRPVHYEWTALPTELRWRFHTKIRGENTKYSQVKKVSLKRRVANREQIMSSLYTKRGWYYLSIMRNGKRAVRAICTKNLRIAQKLRPAIGYDIRIM